jgi:hypothetical protein
MNCGTLRGSHAPREEAAAAKPPSPHAYVGAYRRPGLPVPWIREIRWLGVGQRWLGNWRITGSLGVWEVGESEAEEFRTDGSSGSETLSPLL